MSYPPWTPEGPRSLRLHTAYWQIILNAQAITLYFFVEGSTQCHSRTQLLIHLSAKMQNLEGPRSLRLHTIHWRIILNAQGHHFIVLF